MALNLRGAISCHVSCTIGWLLSTNIFDVRKYVVCSFRLIFNLFSNIGSGSSHVIQGSSGKKIEGNCCSVFQGHISLIKLEFATREVSVIHTNTYLLAENDIWAVLDTLYTSISSGGGYKQSTSGITPSRVVCNYFLILWAECRCDIFD